MVIGEIWMTDIDLLLEKFLTAFKKYGHTLEIFENPTKSELREIGDVFRFILDSKRKKCYIWPATGAVHADAWTHIKKQLNDARPLYKSSTLIPGVKEQSGWIHIYGAKGIPRSISDQYAYEDWSFAKKYIDLNKLQDTVDRM
jgi:hypothetical protein